MGRVELYTHQRMVNWLSPTQLLRTAIRVAQAETTGEMADQRMVQAALYPPRKNPPIKVGADGQHVVWIDYLADTGDGWDSTYSMACCVSQSLDVYVPAEKRKASLPQGQVLLLGGDQVYPTPAKGGYRTRFLDPFRAAFPSPVPPGATNDDEPVPLGDDAPCIVATPGNHDWYDGLHGFARLFCCGRPIGGWNTCQRTSYYVLELPGGWWIWGIDVQLGSEIDGPQYDYFKLQSAKLKAGDRVMLCAPEPSWVDEMERMHRKKAISRSAETKTPRFRSLSEIEALAGTHLAVVLAGDQHHFAYYEPLEERRGPHRITCGGGGAYMKGTQRLPKDPMPIKVGGIAQQHQLKAAYPDAATSKALRNKAVWIPCRNSSFGAFLVAAYLLWLWILQSASLSSTARVHGTFVDTLANLDLSLAGFCGVLGEALRTMLHSPASVLVALCIVVGCGRLSARRIGRGSRRAFSIGVLHGTVHLLLALVLFWLVQGIGPCLPCTGLDHVMRIVLFTAAAYLLGGLLFGAWMVVTNHYWGLHAEEVFSGQAIPDYKCFLRMRFAESGLEIYPIRLDKVCRDWDINEDGGIQPVDRRGRTWKVRAPVGPPRPRFKPAGNAPSPANSVELIGDEPIHI